MKQSMNCATNRTNGHGEAAPGASPVARVAGMATAAGCLVLAHVGLWREAQPIATWFYPIAWWSYIVLMDGFAVRLGARPLLGAPWGRVGALCATSLIFWLIFEAVNLRIANWYYVGVPESWPSRWLGISISFATVLPLMAVTARVLGRSRRIRRCRVQPWRPTPARLSALRGLGALFLILPLMFPRFAFPLVWGFMVLMLDPLNYRAGRPSLIGDLSRGRARRVVVLLASGLVCGLLWETWNHQAVGKWIYTVPFFSDTRLFEMPVAGFLGFPPLALAGFVFATTMAAWWRRTPPLGRWGAGLLAAIGCVTVLGVMQRTTVDATVPTLAALPVLSTEEKKTLNGAGVGTLKRLAESPDGAISGVSAERMAEARAFARLARFRGMGHDNALTLWRAGIRNTGDLAGWTVPALAAQLGPDAPEARKLAVWIRDAGAP